MNGHRLSEVLSGHHLFLKRRARPSNQESKPETPELIINVLTNEPDGESKTIGNNNKGLKFRKLNDDQIIVENGEKTKVEHFTEPKNRKKLMLYNFKQIEHFCQRFGKGNSVDEVETDVYRYYIVIKNFSDEKLHVPGKESQIYRISGDIHNMFGFEFSVYANGKSDEHKGFVYIDIKIEKSLSLRVRFLSHKDTILYISAIDNEGTDRYIQTEVFDEIHDDICGTDMMKNILPLCKFVSRETVLCKSPEILHSDDLVLCISVTSVKSCFTDIEKQIELSFEIERDGGYVLFLESDIGKILCKNSNVFQNKVKETQIVRISLDEVSDLKNICRLLIGANYIQLYNYENIATLYRMAHRYEIHHVMKFCRCVFKKHALFADNISLIHDLAESYNDVDFKTIVESFRKHNRKYEKFICNAFIFDCEGEESKTDDLKSQHIHYVRGEYIHYDNLVNTDQQYRSFNANYEEIETKLNVSSVFNADENGEITLPLDSDFGKMLCERSNVLKDMIQCQCLDTHTDKIEIPQKDFEAFKNVYRIFMEVKYIKATTIVNIISLYEVSDFYDIPIVMEICRNIFQKHICIRNDDQLLYLSKRCRGDIELENIVLNFKAGYQRYSSRTRYYYPEWLRPTRISKFVEVDEILNFHFDTFNFYQ